jgi:hypothetical protein
MISAKRGPSDPETLLRLWLGDGPLFHAIGIVSKTCFHFKTS